MYIYIYIHIYTRIYGTFFMRFSLILVSLLLRCNHTTVGASKATSLCSIFRLPVSCAFRISYTYLIYRSFALTSSTYCSMDSSYSLRFPYEILLFDARTLKERTNCFYFAPLFLFSSKYSVKEDVR